jgi:hypothetical protein
MCNNNKQVGGGCAGFGFWGLVYPLETIKTRMQSDKIAVKDRAYKNMLDCAKKTYVSIQNKLLKYFPYSEPARRNLISYCVIADFKTLANLD